IWDNSVAGMDNRTVVTLGFSSLDFARAAAANFPHDFVTLVDPIRGTYGLLTKRRSTALIDDVFAAVEDRLKVTSTFSLVAGLRVEHLALDRTATNVTGASMPGFPFSKTWEPATGRFGFTWEAIPRMTFYGQYATAADLAAD